ncbi:MAG: hypothetical protein ACRDZO_01075 [Egibacteraceae bacterium]
MTMHARLARRLDWLPDGRMIQAELLKLRTRRGLVAWGLVLTIGTVLARYGLLVALHETNPTRLIPAGGVSGLANSVALLTTSGVLLAVITGAIAGTADVDAGVFGDLVTTGRSRYALFAARVPGGLAFLVPLLEAGYATAVVGSFLFTGPAPVPTADLVSLGMAWVLLRPVIWFVVALGVASLVGSRSAAIGIVLGWQFVVEPVLGVFSAGLLTPWRYAGLTEAVGRLEPPAFRFDPNPAGELSVTVAVGVILVWLVAALAAGAWRTKTRDL